MIFGVLKLLSFLPFGGMLRGTSLKVIGVIGLAGIVAFGYWKWKSGIENEVREEINAQILEERIKEQEKKTQLLLSITEKQNEVIELAIARSDKLRELIQRSRIEIGGMEASPATPPLEAAMAALRALEGKAAETAKKKPEGESTGNSVIDDWKKKLLGDKDE